MKTFFTFLAALVCVTGYSQTPDFSRSMMEPNATFFGIQQNAKNFYQNFSDTSEGGGEMGYGRWEQWWSTRVSGQDGTFKSAFNAVSSLLQTPICTTSSVPSNWTSLGPGLTQLFNGYQWLGIVTAVATTKDASGNTIFYAGTGNSGLWKSTDGGQSWQPKTEYLRLPGLGIQDIAIDPGNNDIIYIATGFSNIGAYGVGVLKSTDGGQSWSSTALTYNPSSAPGSQAVVKKVLIDTNNTNTVYALVNDAVFKTTDGGNTWPMIFQLPQSNCIASFSCTKNTRALIDIAMHPANPNVLYVSTDNQEAAVLCCSSPTNCIVSVGTNGGAMLWKTSDGGANWSELTGVTNPGSALLVSNPDIQYSTNINIEVSPQNPNNIYIHYSIQKFNPGYNCSTLGSGAINTKSYLQISHDGGITWLNNSFDFFTTSTIFTGYYQPSYYWNNMALSPTDSTDIYIGVPVVQHLKYNNVLNIWQGGPVSNYNAQETHADIRAIRFYVEGNNTKLIIGTDGGVSISNTPASTSSWQNITETLPITQKSQTKLLI